MYPFYLSCERLQDGNLLRRLFWPTIANVTFFFQYKNRSSTETVCDYVLFQLGVHPISGATPKHGEVRIMNRYFSAFPSSFLEKHFVPDSG